MPLLVWLSRIATNIKSWPYIGNTVEIIVARKLLNKISIPISLTRVSFDKKFILVQLAALSRPP